jgi:hypothetical protein
MTLSAAFERRLLDARLHRRWRASRRDGSPVRKLADLAGRTVGVEADVTGAGS